MKRFFYSVLTLTLLGGAALAQPDHDHRGPGGPHLGNHGPGPGPGFRKGGHLPQQYWGHQNEVDWHAHHLRQPPRGYHWVQNGNNYVLAAVATGLIASIIAANQ